MSSSSFSSSSFTFFSSSFSSSFFSFSSSFFSSSEEDSSSSSWELLEEDDSSLAWFGRSGSSLDSASTCPAAAPAWFGVELS